MVMALVEMVSFSVESDNFLVEGDITRNKGLGRDSITCQNGNDEVVPKDIWFTVMISYCNSK